MSLDDSSDEEKEDLKSNNSKSAPVPISEYTELEELDWDHFVDNRFKKFKPQIFEF